MAPLANWEKILLGIAFGAFIAVVFFDQKSPLAPVPPGYTPDPIGGDLVGDSPLQSVSGPSYFTVNRPYMAPPPMSMLTPQTEAPAALTSCGGGC